MKFTGSLVFVFLFSILIGSAQNFNVQSAANLFKSNNLAKAKQCIDLAAANEQTSNDPKMWYYRGIIYLAICSDTTALNKSEPDAPEKAAVSLLNCLKTDKAKNFDEKCNSEVWISGLALFNKAHDFYLAKDYETAARFYNLIFDILPLDKDNNLKRNHVSTDILYENLYITAGKAGENEKAKGYLQKLIDAKYNDPMIYMNMSNIYLAQKDTAKALTYIEKGRNIFEENQQLIEEEIRIYDASGKTDVLIDKISKAIESNPDNEALYCRRGILYGKKKEFEKAKDDYKKSIEIKPDYLDANYNLGVMYFNEANDKLSSIGTIKNADEYAKAKEKCEGMFNQSQPYFEKAHEISPKDKDVMTMLKQLYFRQSNMDKYNKIKAELDAGGK